MKPAMFLPALAVLGLSGCVTGYGYSDDGYYYGHPSASTGYYGSSGYGYNDGDYYYGHQSTGMGYYGSYGYGYGYGYPGYYGYYPPYGYYYPWPPVVIVRPPPDPGDDDHDDNNDHGGHGKSLPPWRDLNNFGNRPPIPALAPESSGGDPPRRWQPPVRNDPPRPPERVRMPAPTPPMPRMQDDDMPLHKGDQRR